MLEARQFRIHGRVQGVGYRYHAVHAAGECGVVGWVRNLDDGTVEAYASGTAAQLAKFAGLLHLGPRWADVRHVDEEVAELRRCTGFQVR